MNPKTKAFAGTMESSDIFVEIAPGVGGIALTLESPVKEQFGKAIETTVKETLAALGVTAAAVSLKDRGALECTIRARIETAVKRAQ
jgi:citrate lyase subunit gamma (acyl carrier protein)